MSGRLMELARQRSVWFFNLIFFSNLSKTPYCGGWVMMNLSSFEGVSGSIIFKSSFVNNFFPSSLTCNIKGDTSCGIMLSFRIIITFKVTLASFLPSETRISIKSSPVKLRRLL